MSKSENLNFDDFDDKIERINSPTNGSDTSELTDESPQAGTNNDDQNQSSNPDVREYEPDTIQEMSNLNVSEENSKNESNGDSSEKEEVKKKAATPQEALEEIKKQQTHNLYCTNCYHNITTEAILIKKKEVFHPYNRKHFVIKIPHFTWKTPDPQPIVNPEEDDKETTDLNIVLSRIVDKVNQVFTKINWPSWSSDSPWFLSVLLTLLLLSTIVLWSPQTRVLAQNTGEYIRIWFLSLFIYVSSFRLLLVFSLLIIAILAQLWNKEEEYGNGNTNPSRIFDQVKQVFIKFIKFIKMRWSSLSFVSPWFLLTLLLLSTIALWSPPLTDVIEHDNTRRNVIEHDNKRGNVIEHDNTRGNIRRWFLSLFLYVANLRLFLVFSLLIIAILAQLWNKEKNPDDPNQTIVNPDVNQSPEKDKTDETKPNGSNKGKDQPDQGPSRRPAPRPDDVVPIIDKPKPAPRPDDVVPIIDKPKPAPRPEEGVQIIVEPDRETIFEVIIKLIPRDLDILKSIVYGGLMESITSLGVVTSGAASGASTLNVLALGLANLFSGLFLAIHNLREKGEDRYNYLIGDKNKWKRHYVVVVISFIFFGVIPPLFYCLSFKRADKGHEKAAIVLVASLVCVVILSYAKAHAFKKGRLNTMIKYIGLAFGACSLSFIVTYFISDLLEKNGFHELASDFRRIERQDMGSGDAA